MKVINLKNIFCSILFLSSTLSAPALRADEKDLYDFMWLDPDKKVYVNLSREEIKRSARDYSENHPRPRRFVSD